MGRDSRDSTHALAVSTGRSLCTEQERSRMMQTLEAALCRISDKALVALLRAMMEEAEENDRHDTKLD
jgi:hypothetical protein